MAAAAAVSLDRLRREEREKLAGELYRLWTPAPGVANDTDGRGL